MSVQAVERTVVILNPAGLHARPSVAVAKIVRRFEAKVEIRTSYQTADAGDVLQLLSLGAPCGTELVLSATGPDAEKVLDDLCRLFSTPFGLDGEA